MKLLGGNLNLLQRWITGDFLKSIRYRRYRNC